MAISSGQPLAIIIYTYYTWHLMPLLLVLMELLYSWTELGD